jgi:hypothetical protein
MNNYKTGDLLLCRYDFQQIDAWYGGVITPFTECKTYRVVSHTIDSFTVENNLDSTTEFSHKFVEHLFDLV